jgi:hypothetical protein
MDYLVVVDLIQAISGQSPIWSVAYHMVALQVVLQLLSLYLLLHSHLMIAGLGVSLAGCAARLEFDYGTSASILRTLRNVPSADDCCRQCNTATVACAFWTYRRADGTCLLKSDQGAGAFVAAPGFISGAARQTAASPAAGEVLTASGEKRHFGSMSAHPATPPAVPAALSHPQYHKQIAMHTPGAAAHQWRPGSSLGLAVAGISTVTLHHCVPMMYVILMMLLLLLLPYPLPLLQTCHWATAWSMTIVRPAAV